MKERIQKLLALANVASSRRDGETLIEQGRVRVNGKIAQLGDKADPFTDVVEFDGRKLNIATAEKVYIALNKPKHVLTTTVPHRTDDRQTVFDLVQSREHLFSIGRLDADSEGLVVLTNDGDLAQKLTHPKFRHTKTYKVEVAGMPGQDVLDKWRAGIMLDENERTAPCVVIMVEGDRKVSTLRIIMTEGKKRQIRRIGMKLGHQVKRLMRTHIGMLPIGELRPGESRELDARDIKLLSTPSPDLKLLKAPRRTKLSERHPSEKRVSRNEASSGEEFRPTRRISRTDRPDQDDDNRPARRSLAAHPNTQTRPAHRYPSTPYGSDEGSNDERPVRRSTDSRPSREAGSGDRPARRYPSTTYGTRAENSSGERSTRRPSREGDKRPARFSSDTRPSRPENDERSTRRPSSGARPAREGDERPARRFSDSRPDREGDDRPTRFSSDTRPSRPENDERSTRRPSSARPAREGDERPARRFSDSRPAREGDERPARRPSSARPTREGDERPARRYSSDRPAPSREGGERPSRDEGSGDSERPVRRYPSSNFGAREEGNGDSRPPRRPRPAGQAEGTDSRSSDSGERPKGPRRPPINKTGKPSGGRAGTSTKRNPRTSGKPTASRPGGPAGKRRTDKKDRK